MAAAAKKVVNPDNRFETPLIGRLEVTDGKLSYRDPKRKLDLDGTVSTAMGSAGDRPQAKLELKGKLEGQPLAMHFVGGSVVMLRDTEEPYPLDLNVDFGATKLKAKGVLVGNGDGNILRACTHLDVSKADAERAAEVIRRTLRQPVAV